MLFNEALKSAGILVERNLHQVVDDWGGYRTVYKKYENDAGTLYKQTDRWFAEMFPFNDDSLTALKTALAAAKQPNDATNLKIYKYLGNPGSAPPEKEAKARTPRDLTDLEGKEKMKAMARIQDQDVY